MLHFQCVCLKSRTHLTFSKGCGRMNLYLHPEVFEMQSDLLGAEAVLQHLSCSNLLSADFLNGTFCLVHVLVSINTEHLHGLLVLFVIFNISVIDRIFSFLPPLIIYIIMFNGKI